MSSAVHSPGALATLKARGFVQQTTDEAALAAALDAGPVTFYAGFDPTADSLHVGHLLPVMAMAWLQRFGHRPIVVLGGGTAMVGDPTGKDKTREILTPERIRHNLEGQRGQLARFLTLDRELGGANGFMVDNGDWLLALHYIDFLRDIGQHFSVNRMLTAEGTRQRLERNQGMSFIEFNYHLLQSFDYLELWRRLGCTLQLGGDDQWFNILGGQDLIRRAEGGSAHAFTVPLLQTADGKKMGKTEGGAVFLAPQYVGDFDYYQFWINVADADVLRFLKLYTFLPTDEIEALCAQGGEALREAKARLAWEATALARGAAAADDAAFASGALFAKRGGLSEGDRARVLRSLSASQGFARHRLPLPISAAKALVDTQLCPSMSAARRLIQQGGARFWDEPITSPDTQITQDGLLWSGKKQVALILGEGS
jgi:tyrosyl-tRNA synthetase